MTTVNARTLSKSFRYALRGIRHTYRTEQSFRIIATVAVAVLALGALLNVSRGEAIILVLITTFVVALELLNTAVEYMTDLASPRIHHLAQAIKDVMAAAVFLASLGAVVVGTMIFLPHFLG